MFSEDGNFTSQRCMHQTKACLAASSAFHTPLAQSGTGARSMTVQPGSITLTCEGTGSQLASCLLRHLVRAQGLP